MSLSSAKSSLEAKIIITLGLVLASLLGLAVFIELWYDTQVTRNVLFKQVDLLANTVQKSLIKDMSSGRSSDVQQILEAVGTEKGIIAVRIFDEDGRVLKSDHRQDVGQPVSPLVLEKYRAGDRNFISEVDGETIMHVVQPIANAPQCHLCHDSAREINGVLALDFSLATAQEQIERHNKRMVLVYGFVVLLAGGMLHLMLKRMVSDPILGLKSAMAEAETGNLDVTIEVNSADEIGSLQNSFNSMISRVKGLVSENLAQQSELVKNEKELELKQALEEQNSALEAANTEVNDKNRYYMEMLSFISHELKSPLVVLKGYAGMLASGDLGGLNAQQVDAVAAMERGVDSLNDMIGNYMDLSRLERGDLSPNVRRMEIVGEVVRPVMYELAPALEKESMSIRVDCPDTGITVDADPGLMKSVVYNIVSNAVKYGKPGGDVLVTVMRDGLSVDLSVYNDGMGIPEADLGRVFDRFTRLEGAGRARKGSGLGLYLVKLIVEMHGGRVKAESEAGKWARITVTLPSEHPEERPQDASGD